MSEGMALVHDRQIASPEIARQGTNAGERREAHVRKYPVSEKRRFQNRESQRKYSESISPGEGLLQVAMELH
jgi:hypothetical protein